MSQHAPFNPKPDASLNMNQRKVLIVDDDPVIRDMMVDILEGEGYTASTARNGIEALKLLHGDEAYLVFLDVMMPGIDGRQVCEQLAADPHARQRHAIILMSALDRLDEVTSARVEGIIPKPFVVEDVLEMMEQYLG
jgi:CheY-like chemotaxis protein